MPAVNNKILLAALLSIQFLIISRVTWAKNKNTMPVVNTAIGPLPYEKLNFVKGIYKKISGPDNCIESELRMLREPTTGRVFLKSDYGIFIDHLDQRVKNHGEKDCVFSYFNVINANNELENTEVQSCKEPMSVSNIRTLKIKFDENNIKYVFIAKDPIKNISQKTLCELERQK
jgi:hypothetical protein